MPYLIDNIHTISDSRGDLTVLQDQIPFAPKRVFWITNADCQTRGGHAHISNKMILIAITGEVIIKVISKDSEQTFALSNPRMGLYLDPIDWHTMSFSDGAILLVVCSEFYSPDDYIYERP